MCTPPMRGSSAVFMRNTFASVTHLNLEFEEFKYKHSEYVRNCKVYFFIRITKI